MTVFGREGQWECRGGNLQTECMSEVWIVKDCGGEDLHGVWMSGN